MSAGRLHFWIFAGKCQHCWLPSPETATEMEHVAMWIAAWKMSARTCLHRNLSSAETHCWDLGCSLWTPIDTESSRHSLRHHIPGSAPSLRTEMKRQRNYSSIWKIKPLIWKLICGKYGFFQGSAVNPVLSPTFSQASNFSVEFDAQLMALKKFCAESRGGSNWRRSLNQARCSKRSHLQFCYRKPTCCMENMTGISHWLRSFLPGSTPGDIPSRSSRGWGWPQSWFFQCHQSECQVVCGQRPPTHKFTFTRISKNWCVAQT